MTRLHLLRTWNDAQEAPPAPVGIGLRELAPGDGEALGSLFWQAFHDEDAYASPVAARTEADDTLAGEWGPVSWNASLMALSGSTSVGATVILADNAHDGLPLLAYVVTLPQFRRGGIAACLILTGMANLHRQGIRELHLAVLPSNPAIGLYRRLGFRVQR